MRAMGNTTNDNYIGLILDEIRDQNRAVLEAVGDMQKNVAKLPTIEDGIEELKQDMKIVKAAVTDISSQQKDHERRISRLEAA
jgi:phage shock protein A